MKRLFLLVLFLVCVVSVLAVSASKPKTPRYHIDLVVAHEPPSPYFVEAVQRFARDVEERTHGNVGISVATSRQYGTIDQMALLDNLQEGRLQMSAASVSILGYLDEKLWVFEMPFLFRDYDHVAKVIDGPIGQRLTAGLPKENLRALAFTYSGGFKILPTTRRPVHTLKDLEGLRIRSPGNPVSQATFEAWGADPVPAPLQEIDGLARAHRIDGSEMTYSRYFEHHLSGSVLNETHHSFFLTTLLINDEFFRSLPEEYQRVIQESAHQAALLERQKTLEEIEQVRKECLDKGVQVVTLSDRELQPFRVAARPVYEEFTPVFGEDLIRDIQNVH